MNWLVVCLSNSVVSNVSFTTHNHQQEPIRAERKEGNVPINLSNSSLAQLNIYHTLDNGSLEIICVDPIRLKWLRACLYVCVCET